MPPTVPDRPEAPATVEGPVGLLSDTHGRAAEARTAVEILAAAGARTIIHLGDVGSPEVVEAMAEGAGGLGIHLVLGNIEPDPEAIREAAGRAGIRVHEPFGRVVVEGMGIAFLHGDRQDALEAALATDPGWLFHGHTHRRRDERAGSLRIVNPGALHRAVEHTVAVVDPAAGKVEFLVLPRR